MTNIIVRLVPFIFKREVIDQRRIVIPKKQKVFKMCKDENKRNQKVVSPAQSLSGLWSKSSWKSLPGIQRTKKAIGKTLLAVRNKLSDLTFQYTVSYHLY